MVKLAREIAEQEAVLRQGGGAEAAARQHQKGRLTARERVAQLLDADAPSLELGLWAAHGMYSEWGGAPAAGVLTILGQVAGRRVMVIANDATVKAGAFFPATAKKVLRAQSVAANCRLPLLYLVDSAGVFLPLQDEVFPDADDFGRIFRNTAVFSAAGLPQLAAVMGNCVAGGAYLPVLCDRVLMTEGSGLYLAGPALVKAAIGQTVTDEELGGAAVHAQISGTVDHREPDDPTCLDRLRRIVATLPVEPAPSSAFAPREPSRPPRRASNDLYRLVPADGRGDYEVRDVLDALMDAGSWDEFRPEFGPTLVCGTARLDGWSLGVVANQKTRCKPANGPVQFGGVIYADSAEKAARFVLECNQARRPILFCHDVSGFMVGRDAEHDGIIRAGAKLVSAVANCVVPKLSLILGGSYGAGHYALCGKAFDPAFVLAWPNARYAVMGGFQAADTLLAVERRNRERRGQQVADAELDLLREQIRAEYERQTDIRYAAARGWVDAIVDPAQTRSVLSEALACVTRVRELPTMRLGVFQT